MATKAAGTPGIVRRDPTLPKVEDQLPEHLKKGAGRPRGLEAATREDFAIPRLAVCQSMSKARKKDNPAHIPGLEEGAMYNTLTKEIYGEDPLLITPVHFFKNRFKFTSEGGVDCFSPNAIDQGRINPPSCAACPHSAFVDGEAPECSYFMNFPILIHHSIKDANRQPELALVSFKGAGLKYAKAWVTLMRQRSHDIFGGLYQIRPLHVMDTNDYYVMEVTNAGIIRDADLYHMAEEQYTVVSTVENLGARKDLVDDDVAPERGATSSNVI